jgi:hypothetical protein
MGHKEFGDMGWRELIRGKVHWGNNLQYLKKILF